MKLSPQFKVTGSALVMAVVFLGGVSLAHALTLDEQRSYDKWVKLLQSPESHSSAVKQKCGIDVFVQLDPGLVKPFMADNRNAGYFCDTALEEIADTCSDDVGKKAVASKIKSLICKNNDMKDGLSLSLTEGALQFSFGPDTANLGEKLKAFLGSNL